MGQLIDPRVVRAVRDRQRGLTLVELMVSVAISLVILSALTYIYVSSRGAYRANEALARVQETGRFALEWLTRDIRQAGYFGCLSRGLVPDIYADPPPPDGASPGTAVKGFENGTGWTNPTTITRVAGTDVIMMSGLMGVQANVLDKADVVNANIKVDQNCAGITQNDVVMVTDCRRAALIRVTYGKCDPSMSLGPPSRTCRSCATAANPDTCSGGSAASFVSAKSSSSKTVSCSAPAGPS